MKLKKWFGVSACVFTLILAAFAPALMAQTASTGALTVNVKDPSGAVIAGASVTVSNAAAVNRTAMTGGDGSYTFPLLPPGDYKVSISSTGFTTAQLPS